jgi:hypothetical protein
MSLKLNGLVAAMESEEKKEDEDPSWIGFDLDGTVAFYDGWKSHTHIGVPIPKMIALIQSYRAQGKKVKILTARVNSDRPPVEREEARQAIIAYMKEHVGEELPVTSEKDHHMLYNYDDRCKHVTTNTGIITAI